MFSIANFLTSGDYIPYKNQGYEYKNIDGGYGWFIVLQAFMVSVLTDGSTYSFGVFLPLYVREFHQNSATVSWIGSIASGTFNTK